MARTVRLHLRSTAGRLESPIGEVQAADFLEDEAEFTTLIARVERLETPDFNTIDLPADGDPVAVVPAAP